VSSVGSDIGGGDCFEEVAGVGLGALRVLGWYSLVINSEGGRITCDTHLCLVRSQTPSHSCQGWHRCPQSFVIVLGVSGNTHHCRETLHHPLDSAKQSPISSWAALLSPVVVQPFVVVRAASLPLLLRGICGGVSLTSIDDTGSPTQPNRNNSGGRMAQ
jgi:hypothetical protein